MKEEFSIGDLLLHLDTELYYCTQITTDRCMFIMLNPKMPHKLRKRIFYPEEAPKIINNPNWKYYPVIE
jgi:hypothetical protein